MMDERQLKARFWENVNLYAQSRGYKFGVGSSSDIKRLCLRAANEVLSHPDADGGMAGVLIRRADQAFETFIDTMIVAANEIPNYLTHYPGQIGEDTFAKARNALCPIWPFC